MGIEIGIEIGIGIADWMACHGGVVVTALQRVLLFPPPLSSFRKERERDRQGGRGQGGKYDCNAHLGICLTVGGTLALRTNGHLISREGHHYFK